MLDFTFKGVNISVPSTGGPECANYLPMQRRIWETILGIAFASLLVWVGWRNLYPVLKPSLPQWRDRFGRNILLVSMCLVIGCEVGFKLQAQSTIFLLNPCHVTTAIQIYLLAGQPSKMLTSAFRIHLNFLNGPILATVFPETLSRQLPCELFVYWTQHGLMAIAPFYMLRLGGVYNVEPLSDLSWCLFSYGLLVLYHYVILQGLGLPTEINLNKMLCPASKDPFAGPNYRIWGRKQWNFIPDFIRWSFVKGIGDHLSFYGLMFLVLKYCRRSARGNMDTCKTSMIHLLSLLVVCTTLLSFTSICLLLIELGKAALKNQKLA